MRSSHAPRNIYFLKEQDEKWRVGTILSEGSFSVINISEDNDVSEKTYDINQASPAIFVFFPIAGDLVA